MGIFLALFIGIVSIILSYCLFKKWFNHIALYSLIWMVMISLYQLKLINFSILSIETWIVIVCAFVSLWLGSITVFAARSIFNLNNNPFENENLNILLVKDKGKLLKRLLILFATIGIISALQHWMVLLSKYGSIGGVLLNSYHIYGERLAGETKGVWPYVWLFSYFGVILGGIYSAYKGKITFLSILPLLGVILKELARFTRGGILFGLFEFLVSFFLFRHMLSKDTVNYVSVSKKNIIIAIITIILISSTGAAIVKLARNPTDTFKGTSHSLAKFKGDVFISPSIYFYASSHIGVLNKYLENSKEENLPFGSYTFFSVYSMLSKFDFVEKLNYESKGYYIPYWSNTGTFLRNIHSDFGYAGLIIIPYIIGFLCTVYWFRFYEQKRIVSFVILTHLYLIISMSFFALITSLPAWSFGIIFIPLLFIIIERINSRLKIE